jgi:Na+:H+ antiporter, NhaA family
VGPNDPPLFSPGSWSEAGRVAAVLRKEAVGGALLLVATVIALLWANSPLSAGYFDLLDTEIGPAALHLNLTVEAWAADGLLAIFFFVAGLELKREFVTGDLRDPRRAVVPVAAAVGGMIVPALVYLVVAGSSAPKGWAIPTATDIAFAIAVLAVISTHLPTALRTFLLTLAVADDLIAITIIAFFYTRDLQPGLLVAALVPIALFALVAHRCQLFLTRHWWGPWLLLVPLAVVAWALTYASGVHATVAGVLLALGVPVRPASDTAHGLAETLEHRVRPFSAAVAVPVFAFFSAGVAIGGLAGFTAAITSPIGLGVILGLVAGKAIGISGATWLVTRLRHAHLDPDLSWLDVVGLAVLGGIGFTVSLLVSELSFGQGSANDDIGKVAILTASVLAAALAAVVLGSRNRHYRAVEEAEQADEDQDGTPDAFQR